MRDDAFDMDDDNNNMASNPSMPWCMWQLSRVERRDSRFTVFDPLGFTEIQSILADITF